LTWPEIPIPAKLLAFFLIADHSSSKCFQRAVCGAPGPTRDARRTMDQGHGRSVRPPNCLLGPPGHRHAVEDRHRHQARRDHPGTHLVVGFYGISEGPNDPIINLIKKGELSVTARAITRSALCAFHRSRPYLGELGSPDRSFGSIRVPTLYGFPPRLRLYARRVEN